MQGHLKAIGGPKLNSNWGSPIFLQTFKTELK